MRWPRGSTSCAGAAPLTAGRLTTETISSPSSPRATSTSTVLAGACLRAFVRPSCTTRYAARAVLSGTASDMDEPEFEADAHTGLTRLLDEVREVAERRLRSFRWCVGVRVADLGGLTEQADHLAQLTESGVGALTDHAGGVRNLVGRRVGVKLERSGVHAQERDPVGEHVVHLASDPVRSAAFACSTRSCCSE